MPHSVVFLLKGLRVQHSCVVLLRFVLTLKSLADTFFSSTVSYLPKTPKQLRRVRGLPHNNFRPQAVGCKPAEPQVRHFERRRSQESTACNPRAFVGCGFGLMENHHPEHHRPAQANCAQGRAGRNRAEPAGIYRIQRVTQLPLCASQLVKAPKPNKTLKPISPKALSVYL